MSKLGRGRRLTIPKALAEQYGLRIGDEVDFEPSGEWVRLVPRRSKQPLSVAERLALFDASVARQRDREKGRNLRPLAARDWTRDELYDRFERRP